MEPKVVRHHEMFTRSALGLNPGRDLSDIPILVDHDKDDTPHRPLRANPRA
jgi:hypothetical protein